MTQPTLRPCPFCAVVPRERDFMDTADGLVAMQCVDCGAIGPHAENELDAVERWNDRRCSSLVLPRPVRV